MDDGVETFYWQYVQQVDVEKLSFPEDSVLLDSSIQVQMFRFMFISPSHFMFPSEIQTGVCLPMASYQKRVLKELIRRIEAAIRNPDQDVGPILLFVHFSLSSFVFVTGCLI